MKLVRSLPLALLAAYSIWLIDLEMRTSQAGVRPYFADIEHEILLFAVNTTLSAALLGGAALLMLFAALAGQDRGRDSRPFLLSQAGMFGLMAADDRFRLHERIGWKLGVEDHYVLVGWGLAEAVLLAAFCRPAFLSLRAAGLFLAATALFALMFAIDAFVPVDTRLRLSLEDLAKTWAAAMLFGFSWEAARLHLRLGATALDETDATAPAAVLMPSAEAEPVAGGGGA